jgi:hypothetical protein
MGEEFREEVGKMLREMRRIGLNLSSLQYSSYVAPYADETALTGEEFKQAVMEISEVIAELIVFLKERL